MFLNGRQSLCKEAFANAERLQLRKEIIGMVTLGVVVDIPPIEIIDNSHMATITVGS